MTKARNTSNIIELLPVLIANSAKAYDGGNKGEALGLAVNVGLLFHDTPETASLFSQLPMKNDIWFLSSASQFIPVSLEPYYGLIEMRGSGAGEGTAAYVPLCNIPERNINKWHSFEDWWNELIVNDKVYSFSRKDIVLLIANKGGGTNIDGHIDDKYAKLAYDNSAGWIYSDGMQEYLFANSAAYATMRQIAQEVIISFQYSNNIKSYTRKAMGKVNAMYIDKMVYFAAYECEKDPSAAKVLVDSRLSRIDKKGIFCDSLVFNDGSKHERFVIL